MHHSPRKITIHYQETMPLSPQFQVLSPKLNKCPSNENSISTRATSPKTFYRPTSPASKEEKLSSTCAQEYQQKIRMAIEEIERLNQLLAIKSTQIKVLNSHCTKITKDLKERNDILEINRKLEEQNLSLKAQLYRKNDLISTLKSDQMQAMVTNEQNIHPKLEEKLAFQEEQIQNLRKELENQLEERQTKELEIHRLMEKICLCEEHIKYIEEQERKTHQSSGFEEDYWAIKEQYEESMLQQNKLKEKIKELEEKYLPHEDRTHGLQKVSLE